MRFLYPAGIRIKSVGFCGGRKTGEPGEKRLKQDENKQRTQPKYGTGQPGMEPQLLWCRGGERSHHCAIPYVGLTLRKYTTLCPFDFKQTTFTRCLPLWNPK